MPFAYIATTQEVLRPEQPTKASSKNPQLITPIKKIFRRNFPR